MGKVSTVTGDWGHVTPPFHFNLGSQWNLFRRVFTNIKREKVPAGTLASPRPGIRGVCVCVCRMETAI